MTEKAIKKKVPKLRFPGFEGEWEERKLKEISTEFEYGLNAAATVYDGKNKYIRITDIDDTSRKLNLDDVTSPDIDLTIAENYKLAKNDLLFARTGASVGKTYLYRDSDGLAYYAGFLIRARIKTEYDAEFIFQNTMTDEYNKFIRITSQRSGQPGVNAQEYANFSLMVPDKPEQERIGKYFENLDNLITLHQRKLDHLQQKKKGLLQKMFPRNGQRVPELRFPGFSGDWEQRKLSDYIEVSFEKNTDDTYNKGDVLSVSGNYGIVNQIEFQGRSFAGASVSNYGVVRTGDIVYTKSPLKANPYGIIKTNKGKSGIVSTLYAVYRPKENTFSDFVQTYFEQNTRMNNYMLPLVNKGAKNDMKVSSKNALKGLVVFPTYEEQKVISDYFALIDHLITLQQRKLDHLHLQKKALLQQLFV